MLIDSRSRRLGPWDSLGDIISSINNLEAIYVKAIWFESIASGTSGSFSAPTGGTINLNEWAEGVDVLVSREEAGLPTFEPVLDIEDTQITGTLDASGNWTISGIPADGYPISLIYSYRILLSGFDYTKSLEPSQIEGPGTVRFIGQLTSKITGFVRYGADTTGISWDDGTRTFTISPTGDRFSVWVKGEEFVYSSAQTVSITDTEGLWYFYFDDTGTLTATQTFNTDLLVNKALAGLVYWDATNNTAIIFADERHGVTMSGETHSWMHFTQGAQFVSGFGIANITATGDGSSDTHAQIGMAHGLFVDEDLEHDTSDSSQTLTIPAQIPVYYMQGAVGTWRKDVADDFPVKSYPSGTQLLAYNSVSGSTWGQTEVANAKFTLTHIFACNDIDEPIIAIQGQAQYDTAGQARTGATTELNNLNLTGFPTPEMVALYTILWQTSTGYGNTVKARIVQTDTGQDYVDWRCQSLAGGAASGSGDVLGPASSTDNAIVRFNGTGGKTIQDSGVLLSDGNLILFPDGTGLADASGNIAVKLNNAGDTELRRAGELIFSTTSLGAKLIGPVASNQVALELYDPNDSEQYTSFGHSGGYTYLDTYNNNSGSGGFLVRAEAPAGGGLKNVLNCSYDQVILYFNNAQAVQSQAGGLSLQGHTGTGQLFFTLYSASYGQILNRQAGSDFYIILRNAADTQDKNSIYCAADGLVRLYYAGAAVVETHIDTNRIGLAIGTAGKLKIHSDEVSGYTFFTSTNTSIYIDTVTSTIFRAGGTACVNFAADTQIFYYSGGLRLQTTTGGVSIANGTHTFDILWSTGQLILDNSAHGGSILLKGELSGGSDVSLAEFFAEASSVIYYAGNVVFSTLSTGGKLQGTGTASMDVLYLDNLTAASTSNYTIANFRQMTDQIRTSARITTRFIDVTDATRTGEFIIQIFNSGAVQNGLTISGGGAVSIYHAGVKAFETSSNGSKAYGAAATTLFSINNTNPADTGNYSRFDMNLLTDLTTRTAVVIQGRFTTIADATRTSEFSLTGFNSGSAISFMKGAGGGALDFYHAGVVALSTLATGVSVQHPTAAACDLYSDGTVWIIKAKIHGASLYLESEDAGGTARVLWVGNPDGACSMYYDGSNVMSTTAEGISIIGGIKFPATQAPSSDANTLDDYEEGTWTPTIHDADTGGNAGSATVLGTYTKIGRVVILSCSLTDIDTTGMTAGNQVHIGGIPFARQTGVAITYYSVGLVGNVTFGNYPTASYVSGNSRIVMTNIASNAAQAALLVSALTSGSADIRFTIIYEV